MPSKEQGAYKAEVVVKIPSKGKSIETRLVNKFEAYETSTSRHVTQAII